MAQKIVIASLDIDIQSLLKTTADLKKQIDNLKNTQKELTISGQSASAAFVENQAVLKALNSAYSNNIKVITESKKATEQQTNETELLSLALSQEATSIKEARDQNKLLNKLRNETNTTTKEGQAQLVALNAKLDANNEYIKENADAYLKQKINIGNYSESIKEAAQSINPLNGGLSGFAERAQDAGGAGNLLKSGLTGMITGMLGMVKASLAFIATPIGAVLAVIGVVLGTLIGLFKSLDPVMDKIEQGFAAVSAVIDVIRQTFLALITGAKNLKEAFSGLGSSMAQAAKDAANLKEAQQDLNDAMIIQEVRNAKAKQQFDELIVKSKNRTLTEKQRIAFINQAQKIESDNFKERDSLSKKELANAIEATRIKGNLSKAEIANLQRNTMAYAVYLLNTGRITEAELDMLKKASLNRIEILDETTKRLEKSQNAEDKLAENSAKKKEKAAADAETSRQKREEKRQKEIDRQITQSRESIDLFIAENNAKDKSAEQSYVFQKGLYDKEIKDLDLQFKKGKISKTKYETDKLNLTTAFAKAQADAAIQLSKTELDLFLAGQKSKLEGVKNLTPVLLQEEENRIKEVEARRLAQLQSEKKVSQSVIDEKIKQNQALTLSEIEYQTQRIAINSETDRTIQANRQALEDQIKVQKAEQLNAQKEIDLANAKTQFEADLIFIQQQYDRELEALKASLEAKKLTQDQFDEKKRQSDLKKAEMERLASINSVSMHLQQYARIAQGLEGLFGKNKAVAAATALINGGLAVTEILKAPAAPFVEPMASIVRGVQIAGVVGTTARSIAQIKSAKFEQGGIQEIGGKRHSAGGTKFYGEDGTMFEAEKGEGIGILNRGAYSAFMDFNNGFGGSKTQNGKFAGGGIITQGVRSGIDRSDIQQLQEGLAQVVATMPAPIVAVEEIQTVGNRYVKVKQNAKF
jgi:hypothetical protein